MIKLANPNSPLLPTPPQPPTIPQSRPTSLLPRVSAASEGETGALHLSHFPLPIPSLLPPHSHSHISPSLLPNTMRISTGRNPSKLITIKPIKSSPRGHPHLISFHLLNARILGQNPLVFLTMYLTTILTLLPLLRPGSLQGMRR